MDNSQSLTRTRPSTGDAAVDGLLNGAVAGVVMAIYLLLISAATGAGLVATLNAFDLGYGTSPVRGVLIHLAVAAIYGMVFGLACRVIARRQPIGRSGGVIIGVMYGLLLWLITHIILAAGINIALSSVPMPQLAVAHAIYGATLGWLVSRTRAA